MKKKSSLIIISFLFILLFIFGLNTSYSFFNYQAKGQTKNKIVTGISTCDYENGTEWTFDYTGAGQEFTVPCDGEYKFEGWGASGGANSDTIENSVGLGAYTSGKTSLKMSEKIFVYVGSSQGYNAAGPSETSGGGATDFRVSVDSFNSRIMVSAGGGGGMYKVHATVNLVGDAGGLIGYDADATIVNHEYTTGYSGKGGTQTAGGATGIYGAYEYASSMDGSFGLGGYYQYTASGGGGGWYGGGHGRHPGATWPGGGGGSSYISGHAGCLAVASNSSTNLISGCTVNSSNLACSISYTGVYFDETIMIDGRGYKWTTVKGQYVGMPTQDGSGTMVGNSGNGYARITLISADKPKIS